MQAIKDARRWAEAQLHLHKPAPKRTVTDTMTLPTTGTLCFVDAAWKENSKHGGMGIVFRQVDRDGEEEEVTEHRENIGSALAAEAWAIRTALSQAAARTIQELSSTTA